MFPAAIEVIGVQAPGRESRLREPPFEDCTALTGALTDALLPYLDQPFSLLGYSMGSMLVFEVARCLRRRGRPAPEHLFVASRVAPQLPSTHAPIAHLPAAEFLDSIRRYFKPPTKAWEHPELLELLLPVWRADFRISDGYRYIAEPALPSNIHAYCGIDDSSAPATMSERWCEQTAASFTLSMLPGGHFFLFDELARFQRHILDHLDP